MDDNNEEVTSNMDVKINLSGSGLDFDATITLFQAAQIMAAIAKPADVKPESQPELLTGEVTMKPQELKAVSSICESPRQAIELLNATTNPKKIVAIALYLGANSQNGKIISTEDILAEFVKAGEPNPANISRDIKEAVTAGYLYPESRTTFRVLSAADSVPENGFKKVARKRTSARSTNGEPAVKQTVREDVASLPITASLAGFSDYFDLPARSDQILWILKYAQPTLPNGLNRLEIIHISSKLGGDITSKSFASSNGPNIKNGYITITNDIISLTAKADKYMAEKLAQDEA